MGKHKPRFRQTAKNLAPMTKSEYESTVRCFKVAVLAAGVFNTVIALGALLGLIVVQSLNIIH